MEKNNNINLTQNILYTIKTVNMRSLFEIKNFLQYNTIYRFNWFLF